MFVLLAMFVLFAGISVDDLVNETEADKLLADAERRSSSLAKLFRPSFEVGDTLIRERVSGLRLKSEDQSKIIDLVRSQFELWEKQDVEIARCFIVNGDKPLPKQELKKMIEKFQKESDERVTALEKALDETISFEGEGVLLKYVMEVGSVEYLTSPVFNEILDLSAYQKSRIKEFVNLVESDVVALKKSTAAAKDEKSVKAALNNTRRSAGARMVSIMGTLNEAQLTRLLNSKPKATTIEDELSRLPKDLLEVFEDEQRLLNENIQKGKKK
ncbi:MAG: hypothetical protein NTY15_01740 [Planctomycetota bacterium]|nr:hypothetical protein [Planctomycetota bacterium]